MALETGTYISDLVSTNPAGTDTLDKADDHLRLIKSTVKATFPNITGVLGVYASGTGGNVGIGITPSTRLHVYGADTELRVQSSTSANGYIRFLNTSGSMSIGMSGGATNTLLTYDRTNSHTVHEYLAGASGYHLWATNGSERMRLDASGNVGVGTTSMSKKFVVSNGGAAGLEIDPFGRSGETATSLLSYNRSGAAFVPAHYDASSHLFYTSTSLKLNIDTSGNVLVVGSGGLGYGTGSGGTVTQLTSKTTGVTLNKSNGVITMNNAALAAGATVTFTVTNSVITSWDTVIVKPSNSNYRAHATDNATGSFSITITNITGGSLSDAVQISFTILRTVAA